MKFLQELLTENDDRVSVGDIQAELKSAREELAIAKKEGGKAKIQHYTNMVKHFAEKMDQIHAWDNNFKPQDRRENDGSDDGENNYGRRGDDTHKPKEDPRDRISRANPREVKRPPQRQKMG